MFHLLSNNSLGNLILNLVDLAALTTLIFTYSYATPNFICIHICMHNLYIYIRWFNSIALSKWFSIESPLPLVDQCRGLFTILTPLLNVSVESDFFFNFINLNMDRFAARTENIYRFETSFVNVIDINLTVEIVYAR